MEPADLTPHSSSDDPLEARLRRPLPPLPDRGFTGTVMAALPPPSPARRPLPLRTFVIVASALAGFALAAPAGSPGVLQNDLSVLTSTLVQTGAALREPTLLLGVVFAAGSLLYAFRGNLPWRRVR